MDRWRVGVGVGVMAVASVCAGARLAGQVFQAVADRVPIYVTVADRSGRLVTHLDQGQFEAFDNDKPAPIVGFSDDEMPITMALMVDVSGTMSGQFDRVRAAARHVIDVLPPSDRLRIGSFGDEVAISPWLTADKAILRRIVDEELWVSNETRLWTGLRSAMQSLKDEPGRRVVLALTDGVDSCGCPKPAVATEAVAGEFILYAVSIEGRGLSKDTTDVVVSSGGAHFELARTGDLAVTFETIMYELHHQYLVAIRPAHDGRTHRIEIRMRQPELLARARRSYLAPGR
jgi:VWFA-related protein